MTNLFCGECCDYPKSNKKKSFLWGDIVQIAMQFHQSHVQFNEKRLLLEKLKLMAIFLTVYSYKSYSSLHFSKESLNYSGKCLPASVMSHICHLFQTPPKKRIVKIKPELKVVLTRQNQYCWTTHITNRKCLFIFSSATHNTAAAVQCWGLSSLNRNVFSQLSIQKYFCFLVSAMSSSRAAFHFFTVGA